MTKNPLVWKVHTQKVNVSAEKTVTLNFVSTLFYEVTTVVTLYA